MDDLIRRKDAMQRFLKEVRQSGKDHIHINTIKRLLDDVDVAYNVDKVCEQLQEMYEYCGTSNCVDCKYDGKCEPELVFDIVKAGGVNG